MSMAKPLSVLIIEDNESDAQLIARELTKAGYSLKHERVETAAQMRRTLEKQPWEIVISDFNLPEFDGIAALKLLQETGQDIPFIVVSGSMGEETAVAMMQAGSSDYIMKGNLRRLVPAVERELIQAKLRLERKRAEEALQDSKARHQSILQTAMDGFWLVDTQGRLLEVNETYCKMSGYSVQELLAMRIPDLEAAEAAGETAAHIQKIMEKGEDRFETRHRRKDGSNFDVSASVQYQPEEGGRFVAFLQDITERKQMEKEMREHNELFDLFIKNSPIYSFIKQVNSTESRTLHASDNYQQMVGISGSDMEGKTMGELFPAEMAAKMTADDWAVVSGGEVLRLEEELNGRTYDTIKFPITQGDKTLLAGYSTDITERKLAEIALNLSESRYRGIFENSPISLWEEDFSDVKQRLDELQAEGVNDMHAYLESHPDEVAYCASLVKIIHVNQASLDLFNAKNIDQLMNMPVSFEEFNHELVGIASGKTKFTWEGHNPTLTGEQKEVIVTWSVASGYEDNYSKVIVSIMDISERKLAEREIGSLARFPSENPSPTFRIAKDGMLLYINPSGKRLVPEWHLVEGQAVPAFLRKVVSKALNERKVQLIEFEHGKRVYLINIVPFVDSGYANAYCRDITEQKQNQNELQNSVIKLRKTVEGTIETIALIVEARDPYTSGHQKRVAEISVAIAKDLGLPEEQIQGIYQAGLVHDLGKIQVPAEILSKPGQLTKLEFDMIKTHPKVGYDLLKGIEFPWPIAQIIYQHHEREDGSGYPKKLKGDKILIEAKIIGIADVIEAMSSHRPYRPALGMAVALDEIVKHKGTLYDTTVVASYLKVIKKGYQFSK